MCKRNIYNLRNKLYTYTYAYINCNVNFELRMAPQYRAPTLAVQCEHE